MATQHPHESLLCKADFCPFAIDHLSCPYLATLNQQRHLLAAISFVSNTRYQRSLCSEGYQVISHICGSTKWIVRSHCQP